MSESLPQIMSGGEQVQLSPRHKPHLHQILYDFNGHKEVVSVFSGPNWDNSGVKVGNKVYLQYEVLPYG